MKRGLKDSKLQNRATIRLYISLDEKRIESYVNRNSIAVYKPSLDEKRIERKSISTSSPRPCCCLDEKRIESLVFLRIKPVLLLLSR